VARTYVVKQRTTKPFGPFHLEEATLQAVAADGTRTEFKRVSFERGDSVAVLVHDAASGHVVLVRQFRYSVLASKNEGSDGWILELPAGVIEPAEQPDVTARREVEEEIGLSVVALEHIATFFVSPGGTSERIVLFYARTGEAVGAGGGTRTSRSYACRSPSSSPRSQIMPFATPRRSLPATGCTGG
jgi:ADP-ribose pyrophosphatase